MNKPSSFTKEDVAAQQSATIYTGHTLTYLVDGVYMYQLSRETVDMLGEEVSLGLIRSEHFGQTGKHAGTVVDVSPGVLFSQDPITGEWVRGTP